MTRGRRISQASAAALLAAMLSCALLELAVRATAPGLPFTTPAHDVLFLTPDRAIGWKHHPGFTFFWNGRNPYCIEFGVQVTTNRLGFRDREWSVAKPPGRTRIAVLGDSFVEAIQVPIEETAPRQLERLLNERLAPASIEALNFGVSNFGVGQYLMTYDHYVRQFQPDFVVAFASYLNFTRTTQRELSSRLQEFYALSVRPTYRIAADGTLTFVPARDFAQYERGVASLLQTQFAVDRTRAIAPMRWPLALPHWMLNLLSRKARPAPTPHGGTNTIFPDLELNYRILEALNRRVREDGATLLFADAFEYLERYGVVRGSGALARRNREFAAAIGAGYVDVSPDLRASAANPQYECDMHFNATGNHVLARSLARWLEEAIPRRGNDNGPSRR